MSMELLMQYVTYALMAVGIMAFLVSMITQVVKDLPWLVVIACQYFKIVIEWYYIFASFVAAFIVYLVATGGWERVTEIWQRTKYNKQ